MALTATFRLMTVVAVMSIVRVVVSVVAHYSTGYQPWSQWSQSSEGVAFTCPSELDADQGNVLIYYFATE